MDLSPCLSSFSSAGKTVALSEHILIPELLAGLSSLDGTGELEAVAFPKLLIHFLRLQGTA